MNLDSLKVRPKTVINVSRIVSIHYFEFGPSFVFLGEKHDYWEMVYVDKGQVEIRRDDETLTLRQGELLFHQPNEFHSVRSLDSSPNFFVVSFSCTSPAMEHFKMCRMKLDQHLKGYVSSIIKEGDKAYILPKNDPSAYKLIRRENAPIGGEQLIKTNLEQLLIFLLRTITQTSTQNTMPQKDRQSDPLVDAIQQYLLQRVEETVRIEDICNEFDYSRSFLSRYFREQTGYSLAAYATMQKIDVAKQLIRETNLNFAQISDRLSFENPQYFSRVFKRCTGMTPTEFKRLAHI